MTTLDSKPPQFQTTIGEDFANIPDSVKDVQDPPLGNLYHTSLTWVSEHCQATWKHKRAQKDVKIAYIR